MYAFTFGTFQDSLKKCCFGTQQNVIGLDAKCEMTKVDKPSKTQAIEFDTQKIVGVQVMILDPLHYQSVEKGILLSNFILCGFQSNDSFIFFIFKEYR